MKITLHRRRLRRGPHDLTRFQYADSWKAASTLRAYGFWGAATSIERTLTGSHTNR